MFTTIYTACGISINNRGILSIRLHDRDNDTSSKTVKVRLRWFFFYHLNLSRDTFSGRKRLRKNRPCDNIERLRHSSRYRTVHILSYHFRIFSLSNPTTRLVDVLRVNFPPQRFPPAILNNVPFFLKFVLINFVF